MMNDMGTNQISDRTGDQPVGGSRVNNDCQVTVSRFCGIARVLTDSSGGVFRGVRSVLCRGALLGLVLILVGCQTPSPTFVPPEEAGPDRTIVLREGDVVRITFPASPTLNTVQQIRRDGNINLSLVGDVKASGLSPSELEKAIIQAYGDQLVSKEVSVTLDSAAFAIFVTGAVLRPGKVMTDRPITILEAIAEAGGFDQSRANVKAVRVIRREGDRSKTYVINLKPAISGQSTTQFFMRPFDIIHVPERFSFF